MVGHRVILAGCLEIVQMREVSGIRMAQIELEK